MRCLTRTGTRAAKGGAIPQPTLIDSPRKTCRDIGTIVRVESEREPPRAVAPGMEVTTDS